VSVHYFFDTLQTLRAYSFEGIYSNLKTRILLFIHPCNPHPFVQHKNSETYLIPFKAIYSQGLQGVKKVVNAHIRVVTSL